MITKSDFLLYLTSPMHLWASAHNQLQASPSSLYEQHLAEQGQQVESLAHTYLKEIHLPQYTDACLIWQPTYQTDRFKIRADALIHHQDTNTYDLYEIKSSTSVKTQHKYDLTFQVLLLETLLNLNNVYLLHIDKTYIHQDALELEHFLMVENLTETVGKYRDKVAQLREGAWEVTQLAVPLSEFACTKPNSCPCPSLCHPQLPENPVFNIPYIGKKAIQLREQGITAIEDIPPSFNLNSKQLKHVQAVKSGQPLVDGQTVKTSLSTLEYPVYFLDYETFNPAVPLYPGYRPYEHIVYQYSLHVISYPGADPLHYECLLTDSSDPAPILVPDLLNHLGPNGSVVVWNKPFEAYRNKELAGHCPQFAKQLLSINDRFYDLMLIFKQGHYVHPDFHGSASLKAVLPVLCPELRYEDLVIQNGEETMLTWYKIQTGKIPLEDQPDIIQAMKDYCRLDTYGMIAIMEKLNQIIRSSNGS